MTTPAEPSGPPAQPPGPRLLPRPIWRPSVDPAQAHTFGRPTDPSSRSAPPGAVARTPARPEVPDNVAEAFGRPVGSGPTLGRPPAGQPTVAAPVPGDPWRDPTAAARLGEPALPVAPEPVTAAPEVPKLTLRQALFERRLRLGTILTLLLLCLLIGAGGAIGGVLLAHRLPVAAAEPSFTLAPVAPGSAAVPGSVADIAARILPAVVSIDIQTANAGGTGSGVVIDGSGHILTNNHVVSLAAGDNAATINVVFSGAKQTLVPATIVGRDPQSDLAVIKVSVANLTVAQLGDSDKLQVGDPVVAVGSPFGLAGTVTSGIISATHRPVRLSGGISDTNAVIDALQTDAAINPGNSGGALVNGSGAVIGINTAIRSTSSGADESGSIGLGFAIPINSAKTIADELIRTGKAVHATMGVSAKSVTDGSTDGAQVQNVADGSAAASAGIKEGDVIIKVGDRTIADADELVVAVQAHGVGETVPVVINRSGRQLTVQVTLTAG